MEAFSIKEQVVIRHLDDLMISMVAIRPLIHHPIHGDRRADFIECYLYKIATIINGRRYYYVDNIEDSYVAVSENDLRWQPDSFVFTLHEGGAILLRATYMEDARFKNIDELENTFKAIKMAIDICAEILPCWRALLTTEIKYESH